MLPRIESSEVLGRFTKFFNDHNANCPTADHIRKTSRGDVPVTRRVGIVHESITTTFVGLLTAYVNNYNHYCETTPEEKQDISVLPALWTNAVKVGKYARCEDRTVRNHLTKLKKFGIVETKNHGNKMNFELWISGSFLFGESYTENCQKAAKTALLAFEQKNFPVNDTHKDLKKKKETGADVINNKVKCEGHFDLKHGEEFHGDRGKTDSLPDQKPAGESSQGIEQVAPAPWLTKAQKVAERDQKRREKATAMLNQKIAELEANKPKMPLGLDPKFALRLVEFWLYAMRVLYPNKNFSKHEQEKALIAIAEGVYDGFRTQKTDNEWSKFQVYQMQKLDKVAQYLHRNPTKWVPDPFSIYGSGKGYFDKANLRGFVSVDNWMKADQIRKVYKNKAALIAKKEKMEAAAALAEEQRQKAIKCDMLLKTARLDFEKLANGLKPRIEVEHLKDAALLYYFWHTRMASHGQEWREKFVNQYIENETREFKSPRYRKQRLQRKAAGEVLDESIIYVESWMHEGDGFDPSWITR